MADLNVKQVYDNNPSTTVGNNDLFYLGKSPYDPSSDSAIKYSDLATQLAPTVSVGTNTIIIAPNGNDSHAGTFSAPVLTLAGANTIVAANPGTQYNVIDYRKTASEALTIYPNANYISYGTTISFTSGGLAAAWSGGSAIVSVTGYIFNPSANITFNFSSFSTSNLYRLNFIDCGATAASTYKFIFVGQSPAASGTARNWNIYIENFNGSHINDVNASLSFEFQETIQYRFEGGQIKDLICSASVAGAFLANDGRLIQTYISGAPQLSMTSDINTGFMACLIYGAQPINEQPTIVANQTDGNIILGMDGSCYRFDTNITGTATDKVYINALTDSKGVGYDGGNEYFVGAGRDVPWAGTPGLPYATLSYAMTQFVNFGSPQRPAVLTFIDNVDDTDTTTNFVPNVRVNQNGFTWKHGIVGKDASWTKDDHNNSIFWIGNGRIIPATSGDTTWNVDFTAETDIGLTFTMENISTTDRDLKPTDTWQFTFADSNSTNAHLIFNNCQLGDINDGGNNVIKCFGNIEVNIQNGLLPKQFYVDGRTGAIYLWIIGAALVDQECVILNNCTLYLDHFSNVWDQYVAFVLLGASGTVNQIFFDTSLLDISLVKFGLNVDNTTQNSGGSGYTSATVAFDAPSLPFGVTATGTANIVGDAVDSITITDHGSGYTSVPAITIMGDGTGADFTAVLSDGTFNQWLPQVNDTVIIPTYIPTNYTPVPVVVTGSTNSRDLLKSHLNGIDNALAMTTGLYQKGYIFGLEQVWTGFTTFSVAAGACLDSTGTYNIIANSPMSLDLDVAGAGGIDTGSAPAASTIYYRYLITKSSVGSASTNVVFSTNPTAPDLSFDPDFDKFKRIGFWKTVNGAAQFGAVTIRGNSNERTYYVGTSDADMKVLPGGTATSAANVDCSAVVPPNLEVAFNYVADSGATAANAFNLVDTGFATPYCSYDAQIASLPVKGQTSFVPLDSNSKVNYLWDSASTGRSLDLYIAQIREYI